MVSFNNFLAYAISESILIAVNRKYTLILLYNLNVLCTAMEAVYDLDRLSDPLLFICFACLMLLSSKSAHVTRLRDPHRLAA